MLVGQALYEPLRGTGSPFSETALLLAVSHSSRVQVPAEIVVIVEANVVVLRLPPGILSTSPGCSRFSSMSQLAADNSLSVVS